MKVSSVTVTDPGEDFSESRPSVTLTDRGAVFSESVHSDSHRYGMQHAKTTTLYILCHHSKTDCPINM